MVDKREGDGGGQDEPDIGSKKVTADTGPEEQSHETPDQNQEDILYWYNRFTGDINIQDKIKHCLFSSEEKFFLVFFPLFLVVCIRSPYTLLST